MRYAFSFTLLPAQNTFGIPNEPVVVLRDWDVKIPSQ